MAKKTEASAKNKKPGFFAKIGRFFKEARSELKKVVWPTPKQTTNDTLVVLVIALIAAVFIGVVDFLFKSVVGFIPGI